MPYWTPHDTNRLRALRAQGKSFGTIARLLGVSRGAVAGKVDRLKNLDARGRV